MTGPRSLNYLGANWLEIAGTVTTVVGIWLTTRRTLLCWPVVLAADVIYLIVFYRAQLLSDALLQIFLWRSRSMDGGTGGAAYARMAKCAWCRWRCRACYCADRRGGRQFCARRSGQASACGAALSGCDAHKLQSSGKLVAGAQTHRELVALDRGDTVYIGEYLYKDLRATALLYAGLVALAVIGPARLAARAGGSAV